ncbi:MAG: pantetheine-phosphate adenylyltransferase [Planctomycetaceae bacterium]
MQRNRDNMPEVLNPRHAVYVGSFDPITLGHEDIIRRGCQVFEHITVGIGLNPDKPALFSPDERLQLARQILSSYANVTVQCFEGLSVDFVRACNAAVMLRGVRTLSDMEFEFSLSLTNRILAADIETVFLMASEAYSQISSTLIKQIAKMGQDATRGQLTSFVAADVIDPLLAKFAPQ